ncbi:uncharacterized protein CBL_00074 [Carabus blaptoides fortunei]
MDNVEELNYDCNYNMFLAKSMLENLRDPGHQQKAVKWMRKLSACNESVAEMKLRNDFMYHLVVNIQNHKLKEPFTEEPPHTGLQDIIHKLPKPDGTEGNVGSWGSEMPDEARTSFLYENSPDGGEFLGQQPIPRCGAFCYLAVISKKKE